MQNDRLPPLPDLPSNLKAQISDRLQVAEELRVALGRPPEGKYEVLAAIYSKQAATEAVAPQAAVQSRVFAMITGLLQEVAQGLVRLDPLPVRTAFAPPTLGAEQARGPLAPAGSGSFRLPMVLIPTDTGSQRVRVNGRTIAGANGVSVDVRLTQYQARGGDLPLEGYGIVLLDPGTEEPIRVAPTDSTGTVFFRDVPPAAIRQYARVLILTPALFSTLPHSDG